MGETDEVQSLLRSLGSTELGSGASLAELIRRPELDYDLIAPIDPARPDLSDSVREQININLKYEGYIKRQIRQVAAFRKKEKKKIPDTIDYDKIGSLRLEARQKLKKFRPRSIGQASRIQGVSPADVSVLLIYIESQKGAVKENE